MKILNYGSMNIDNVYSVAHIAAPGETILANQRNVYCGGKGLNQSIALAKAGANVYHAGVVGDDGDMLLALLTSHGVNTEFIKRAHGPSAHTVIQVNAQGQNCIIVFADENMRIEEAEIKTVLEGFEAEDILVLQNELHNSPLMMKLAKAKGMRVVFNPSPTNEAINDYPLGDVDWFLLNEVEGCALTGQTAPDLILRGMQEAFPNASVVLTLGQDGAYCMHGDQTLFQPAFKVQAVDTTAAGDTFTGYFITGFSRGDALDDVLIRAARASSIAVSKEGAADSIPYAKEVEEALR
ncbi:MAG: ribokinase [Clostridiales bacterium]|nr:ribokinase [Clostridiales bacterium]